MRYTIQTLKGGYQGSLRSVCKWQAEHQGAAATIRRGATLVDVSDVDFDADDLRGTIRRVLAAIKPTDMDTDVIEAWSRDAGRAGDMETVALCDRAAEGVKDALEALAECERGAWASDAE